MKINLNIYNIVSTILVLILLLWSMYSRIKYLCLKKASEEIVKVEKIDGLNKQQRFALVVTWLDKELPKIFRNSTIRALLEKLVNYAYNTIYDYTKSYLKRKTGFDIENIVDKLQASAKYTPVFSDEYINELKNSNQSAIDIIKNIDSQYREIGTNDSRIERIQISLAKRLYEAGFDMIGVQEYLNEVDKNRKNNVDSYIAQISDEILHEVIIRGYMAP